MNQASVRARLGAAAFALLLLAGPAAADPLDGRWCMAGGRRMTIDGPVVTLPGGARITGDYSRGALVYRVPGAETTVILKLLDEERLQRATDPAVAKPEIWHRCGPPMI